MGCPTGNINRASVGLEATVFGPDWIIRTTTRFRVDLYSHL
jgi:hypothetical protein